MHSPTNAAQHFKNMLSRTYTPQHAQLNMLSPACTQTRCSGTHPLRLLASDLGLQSLHLRQLLIPHLLELALKQHPATQRRVEENTAHSTQHTGSNEGR
jgi:hypothetical protein